MTKRQIKGTLHITLAIVLLIVGVAGLVLPILNGTFFIVVGLILLSFEHKKTEQFLERYASKHKSVEKVYIKMNSALRSFFGIEK